VRLPWTAFWITWVIGAAAWVMAGNIAARRAASVRQAVVAR